MASVSIPAGRRRPRTRLRMRPYCVRVNYARYSLGKAGGMVIGGFAGAPPDRHVLHSRTGCNASTSGYLKGES
jgi:hypothetical protein